MTWQSAKETLAEAAEACIGCGDCIPRCEVLEEAENPEGEGLSVGALAQLFLDAMGNAAEADEAAVTRVRELVEARPNLAFTVRRCCMDGYCTLECPTGVVARKTFATLREVLYLCGLIDPKDFTSTQVDTEWDIFSVYRAVYGIWYENLPKLEDAADLGADTLFFPGCALGSYAPELTEEVFGWLQAQGINAVLSLNCCGSPLRSPGRADRADAWAKHLVDTALEQGIRRVVFVCPGCRDEWEAAPGSEALELVGLPVLMAEAGVTVRPDKVAALGKGAAPVLAPMDSCHDRDGRFGDPLREVLTTGCGDASESACAAADDACAACSMVDLPYSGENAVCCGAAGSVSLVDPAICDRRVARVLDEEPAAVGADVVVANCPICAYTFAGNRRAHPAGPDATAFCHYLDLVCEASFDWDTVFSQLESMWTGEYGAWVQQTLL